MGLGRREKMEMYVKVMFWLYLVANVLSNIVLGYGNYPRQTTRGTDAIGLIIAIPLMIWAWYLLYGG